ncbi:MAG: hypothetical protein NTZ60_03240 [Campylobacterales bacterium]|nr:hypothetical protein [Campylobacterales bacterium]
MNKTTLEKEEFTVRLFSSKSLFEEEILRAKSDAHRAEIMKILAVHLVRDALKEELNFLYIKNLSDFTLVPIKNILFKEIANEWLVFALEILHYSRDEALHELQDKKRVQFILSIVHQYLEKYQHFIFEEIIDTFLELVVAFPHAKNAKPLVEEVFQSHLINTKLLPVHNFEQLHTRVKAAINSKNMDINKIHIKMNEINEALAGKNLEIKLKTSLLKTLEQYQLKLDKINHETLEKFDATLKRIKDTMVYSMVNSNYL